MKFLYSLLFIFIFVSSSYCSTTMGDTTCDVNSPFNKIEQSLNQDLGCVNPSYYKEGTIYSCSPSAINEQEQHFVSGYCSSYGYQKMVRNTWSYLETSSCPEGEVPNSDGVCSAPECTPLSDIPLSLTQSQCENGAFYSDYNTGLQGQLGWNDCDSTCYLLEAQYMSCEQLGSYYQSSCDTSKNNFNFSCTATNGVPQIDTENTWCKPKSNPCDDLFQRVEATCTDNQVITGYDECRHDGINVLNPEVIKCVDNNSSENPAHQKPWDCTSYFHKSWDDSSKTCSCSSGYELSLYGSCKKSLDTNATQAEKDSADKLAKDDALNKDKMENDRNSSIEQNRHLSNIDNTLSHISRDLNTSNSLLGSVKDSISDLSSKFDSNGSSGISFNPTDSMNQLKDNYSSIYSSIDNIKSILANGLVNPIPSGSGNTCAYSHTIEGSGITVPVTFDPCTVVHPYYSTLYNIWYFLFFAAFLVFSIKLLLISKGD